MAEKKFLKGLFKDTAHIDQPEGTWRYAKNALLNQIKGAISNEGGNIEAGSLDTGSTVIGIIEVDNDKAVIFSYNNVNKYSEIGIWQNGGYSRLYFDTLLSVFPGPTLGQKGLELSAYHPIEGTYNVNPKGELIIYWTDDFNPPRALNVTLQQSSSNEAFIYSIDSTQSHENHIHLLDLFPNSGPVPHIELDEVINNYQKAIVEGGGLLTGSYYLSLAYVDDSFTATNFVTVSNPVSIVDEFDHVRPTTKKDGAKSGSQTSKAIRWVVSNLAKVDYKYIRPVIIRKKEEAVEAFQLNDLEIILDGNNQMSIVFSGIEGFTPTSVDDVIIDTVSYETAKTINQLDGVLYVGNLTGTNDLGYQKYANNIKLNSVVKTIEDFDKVYLTVDNLETGFGSFPVDQFNGVVQQVDETSSYRYLPNIFKYKGYQRDEVYAFYIAFILNDGSMSYAYHIPGREDITKGGKQDKADLPITGANGEAAYWEDIKELSPAYIKKYHFYDHSDVNLGPNQTSANACRHMNYWENSTEIYPNTNNFEVWDPAVSLTAAASLIQGSNVRHHHFPSNGNSSRQSIISHNFNNGDTLSQVSTTNALGTSPSDGLDFPIASWAGTNPSPITAYAYQNNLSFPYYSNPEDRFIIGYTAWNNTNASYGGYTYHTNSRLSAIADDWKTISFSYGGDFASIAPTGLNGSSSDRNQTSGALKQTDTLIFNSYKFVADQPMKIRVNWRVQYILPNGNDIDIRVQLRIVRSGVDELWNQTLHSTSSSALKVIQDSSQTYRTLDIGDSIYMRAAPTGDGSDFTGGSCYLTSGDPSTSSATEDLFLAKNHMSFDIIAREDMYEADDLHDVELTQKVNILGFELEDIKIPRSIADKVQGFRVYRARRGHENKRILGQSAMLPMFPESLQMGLCEEAFGSEDASQILSASGSLREKVYSAEPWGRSTISSYPYVDMYFLSGYPSTPKPSQKVFAFYDFHLLRTKNSLAGATHIKPEYLAVNYVWNGPTINQDKKMVSKIITDDSDDLSEPIKKIEQFWGWDTEFNCYPKQIKGALSVGCIYLNTNNSTNFSGSYSSTSNVVNTARSAARLIGQKAKTYLQGDSIYDGKALGFGGKIFNGFGESLIAFGLKDKHELWAGIAQNAYTGTDPSFSNAALMHYGLYQINHPFILVNPSLNDAYTIDNTYERSQTVISNLHAFKTDVYKNIDNQELIWTGYEVLGGDLDNFVFEDDGTPAGSSADYKTSTVNSEGIFGGDTYLCRYGFRSTLTPSNTDTDSEPIKGIHYHIVESQDNINFRHSESNEDLYFPGSIAKEMLKVEGDKDFTHMDNLKYDDSFSTDNDIRPAFPLPLRENEQNSFPTRAHRSAKRDTSNLKDNYRTFLANDFKDLPKNRGDLWKLSTFNNLLYFHMEESLYATKGKQSMQMKDGSEAFVGSGDIFAQEPDEVLQSERGYAGTQSQWAAITTRSGYFFVDKNSRKVFMMTDKLTDISNLGLENWFRDNLKFNLESLIISSDCLGYLYDNPISGIGLTAVYDPKFKRILLTKRDKSLVDPVAFQAGIDIYQAWVDSGVTATTTLVGGIKFNCNLNFFQEWTAKNGGAWITIEWDSALFTDTSWTISYYPEFQLWCGFHDYVPYIYFNTSKNFYSFTEGDINIWEHNSNIKGSFYGTVNPFEIEYIHNEFRGSDGLVSSFNYTLETFNTNNVSVLEHGFTSFFMYNTFQLSGEENLEYLVNTRRVGNNWKINNFRDMAAIAVNTNSYYMAGTLANPNIIGGANTGTITSSSTINMFTVLGMNENINNTYLNLLPITNQNHKRWFERKKFMDKWAGIRLICDNNQNNLLNLYSTSIGVRQIYR